MSKLSDDEISAVQTYKDDYYREINNRLRKKPQVDPRLSESEIDDKIALIDSAMDKYVIHKDHTFKRGEKSLLMNEILSSLRPGQSVDYDSYTSISDDETIALSFSGVNPRKAWNIEVKSGTKGVPVGGAEVEVLLPKNGKLIKVNDDTLRWEPK